MEYTNDKWIAWRESYLPGADKAKNHKVIAQGSFNLVMARTKNYMKYIKRNWNK